MPRNPICSNITTMEKNQKLSSRQLQIRHDLLITAVFTLFYLFFFFLDGAVLHADSHSYLYMDISREPVYPLFLAVLRSIFGEGSFLLAASFLQNLVNAACSAYLAIVVAREFFGPAGDLFGMNEKGNAAGTASSAAGLKMSGYCASRLVWEGLILFILMAPSLLTRFVAKRGSTFSCSIMTESLTIPLWLLAFAFFLEILRKRGRKKALYAAVTIIVLIATRKQMLVMLPLFFLVLAYTYWLPSRSLKKALFCIALPVACFLCVAVSERVYNYALHGLTLGHTDSNNTIFTILIYASEPGDEQLLGDRGLDMASYAALGDNGVGRYLNVTEEMLADPALYSYRELYGDLITQADRDHLTLTHAGGSSEHFSESYDAIAIALSQPTIEEWLNERGVEGTEAKAVLADQVRSDILKTVLPRKLPRILQVYAKSFVHGMCLTVAGRGGIFAVYSALAYAVFLVLIILAFKGWPESPAGTFGATVLLGILGNVTLTTLVIFCQFRYMVYNMPLFYLAFLLLIREVGAKGQSAMTCEEAYALFNSLYPDPKYPDYDPEAGEASVKVNTGELFDIHVAVPAYNVETTVEACLDSILDQKTEASVIVTVVEDGATDGTWARVLQYAKTRSNQEGEGEPDGHGDGLFFQCGKMTLQLISQKNGGLAAARNRVLRAPRGKYFLFVDSDDLLAPGAIEALWKVAGETDADLVEGEFIEFPAKALSGSVFYGNSWENQGMEYATSASALSLLHGYPWGKLYRAGLWRRMQFIDGSFFDDTLIFFLVYPLASSCAKLKRVVYGYRSNPVGLTSLVKGQNPKALDAWYMTEKTMEIAIAAGVDLKREDVLRQFVKQLLLNGKRVRSFGSRRVSEALFVLECGLYERLEGRFDPEMVRGLPLKERELLRMFREKNWMKYEALQL